MDNRASKKRAELFFEKSTALMIRFRLAVVLGVLVLTVLSILQIRHLGVDTSNEGFLHDDDPILLIYNEFRDQFGRDDKIAVAIQSDEIFTAGFLAKLEQLHEELKENVPYLSDITSMINARNTHGEGDVLMVDDLLADFPETEEEYAALKQLVLSSPLYKNMLISEDGTLTSIVLESEVYADSSSENDDLLSGFDDDLASGADIDAPQVYLSDQQITTMVETIRSIAQKYNDDNFRTYVAGTTVITQTLKKFMMADMKRFMGLAIITIGFCLFIMFRRVSGVIMPLLVVALTLVASLGVMALTGTKFKTPTTILPSFLLAVGVGDCVHALALTYLNLRKGKTRNEAITSAYSHCGLAIVMTSLTTAAGLASFAIAKVAPIADLGLFSAIGVMIALLYTFTFLPAVLSFIPLKAARGQLNEPAQETMMDRLLHWVAQFSVRRYRTVLALSGTIILVGIVGLFRVYFSHDVLTWLPENLDVRQSTEIINEELRGSVVLELVLDTGRENGLYDKATLTAIDRLAGDLENDYRDNELFIGKVISLTTILKEIHQALHENKKEFYKIPDNERLIPQELLLFENSGSDDLEDVIDSQFRLARITLKVPWLDALLYTPFINEVEKRFKDQFEGKKLEGGEEMQVTVTGIMSLLGNIFYASIYSAAQSYGIALVVVTLLMVILIGELRLGLISMIPNLGPILIVLGFIGWFSIPLNMFTMLVASIAIGLSVDNTIHFMYNFRKYYEKSGDIEDAVRNALNTAGRALLTTTVVLSIGFFIFMFASMKNLFEFGLFTGIAIILALASNFFMAPALLTLVIGKTNQTQQS
jgi:predicted RND superfamily exporter protein